ncbi:tetratricopeptide repeat protein [Cytophaga aurantiaca]|uniref:tetratricopeptide repeat protein n=1 Tax=Cytophaga aurantiaca TaxID=29530 RepID=UPI0003A6BBAD|nr:tetratricopeptide repeat protein [Cytophaga aurantiaca]
MAHRAWQQKSYKTAENTYRQILRDYPKHPDAQHLLGLVYSEQGKYENAIRYISEAITTNPDNTAYYSNLGEVYRLAGEWDKALSHFQKALQIQPDFVEAKFNLANGLHQKGDTQQAFALYAEILVVQPTHIKAAFNSANILMANGQYRSAIDAFRKVLAMNNNHADAHNNLAIVLSEWDHLDEAEIHYKNALALNPQFSEAKKNLINLLESIGKSEEARELIRSEDSFRRQQTSALLHEKSISPTIHCSQTEIAEYREELLNLFTSLPFNSFSSDDFIRFSTLELPTLSNLIYQGEDDLKIKTSYAALFKSVFPEYTPKGSVFKKHIGIVVTSGHEGVFLKCMRGILNTISTETFRITVICSYPNGEKIIRPVLTNPDVEFLSIPNVLSVAAELILKSNIDLLYYWECGTDKINYFLPFMRLAPIQCISWGWPITSGIPNMDYFISAANLETDNSQSFYTEQLYIQKRIPVYYYRPPIPVKDVMKPISYFGLNEINHHYICQQNLRKVHPDFDALVKGILEQDPLGIVIFINDKNKYVSDRFKKRLQVSCKDVYSRIVFLERLSENDYLNVLLLSDVALDTTHYGGGANTCYDAFACGTPLVTLTGMFHRSRFAFAAYQQMNYTYCVAHSSEEYIQKAVQLGTQKELRKEVSASLKKASNILFEDIEAVKELEHTFEKLISISKSH